MTPAPVPTTPEGVGLHARITDSGHYTWFAFNEQGHLWQERRDNGDHTWYTLDVSNWVRHPSPYDETDGDSRWMVEPTREGEIRILVEGIDYAPGLYQSSGFDLHLGSLGEVSGIDIHSDVLRTEPLPLQLIVALYLDKDENGEFFVWEESSGRSDHWAGYGGDEMGFAISHLDGDETVRIDDETAFTMANHNWAWSTLGKLKNGEIEWSNPAGGDAAHSHRSGRPPEIDAETTAALYVGLVDNADGQPADVLITDVVVERA